MKLQALQYKTCDVGAKKPNSDWLIGVTVVPSFGYCDIGLIIKADGTLETSCIWQYELLNGPCAMLDTDVESFRYNTYMP